MKLLEYAKTMKTVQAILVAIPLLSAFFDRKSGLPFPPLGDHTGTWRVVALVILLAAMTLPYSFPVKSKRRGTLTALVVLTIVFAGTYGMAESYYVVPVHFGPSEDNPEGAIKFVCRGNRRADLEPRFAKLSEEDLIKSTGTDDERLTHVYTSGSLLLHRQELFWSYTLSLGFLELLLGTATRTQP